MTTKDRPLSGRVALVTGSSRGIGFASAERLASEGADIVLNYFSQIDKNFDDKAHEKAVEAIRKHGVDVFPYEADVASKKQVEAMVSAANSHFGHIDILVNNAGGNRGGRPEFTKLSEETWDLIVDTNLKGTFMVTQAVAPGMISRRFGKIVNISSEQAFIGEVGMCAYVSAKAGIIGLTKVLAKELAPYGVLVNCVAPGPTDTDALPPVERTETALKGIPLGRLGRPQEIAAAVYFLVSPDTTWTTGWVFSPNGGVVMR